MGDSDNESVLSSIEDLPVYFRVFTRDSLKAIEQRMAEAKIKEAEEKARKEEMHHVDDDDDDDGPCPDEKLEQGASLPIRLSAAFTEDMAGIPLEDIDSFYSTIPTYVIVTKKQDIFRFSATDAMWLLSPFNPVRRVAVAILTHGLFSLFIITTILANCYVMILPASPVTESTEVVFTAIYTFESAVKVMARGFILEKFTYLRDAWNWLDFVVISLAYVTMGIDLGNLSALRTCRVFRALKTVAIVPGLKTIVSAVIVSVMNLRDVIILTVFALAVFGLVGLQIYMGVLTQKCVRNFQEDGSEGRERDINWHAWNSNYTNWYPFPPPEEYGAADYDLCGNSTGAGTCPENYTCMQGYGPNPNYGYTSFDSFGWAFLSSFRLMTQDFWESLYQQILRTAGPWHMLFFIVIIFLGSYYLVNLILAIVAMSYDELEKKAAEEAMAVEAEKEAMREEDEARTAKIEHHRVHGKRVRAKARRAAKLDPDAPGVGNGGSEYRKHNCPNCPSQFSIRSHESVTGELGGGADLGKDTQSVCNMSYCTNESHSKFCHGRKVDQASVSLPGSPYNDRRRSTQQHYSIHHIGQDKLMVLSSYMDAQEHLPYADDSTAATPMSEENGAILLPFCNGLHHHAHTPHLSSRYSSYNSHASRLSYTSHDAVGGVGAHHNLAHPVTKESQLIQRAKNLYGGYPTQETCKHCGCTGSVDDIGKGKPPKRGGGDEDDPAYVGGNQMPHHRGSTGVDMMDVIVLNKIIDQAAGGQSSELSLSVTSIGSDNREPPTLKELIKMKIREGCFRCLDIFCLWDCGFPYSVFKKMVAFTVFDAFTELTITLATVACVIFMALDHYGLEQNVTMNNVLKAGNSFFTALFTLECAMKIIAMSPKFFFQVGWNIFDFLIVAFGLVEVAFEDANLPGLSSLRSFRLLRVFKLAKSWPALNMIMTIMGQTVGALSNLVFVLVIIIFIFAVMGMQLFAKDYFEKYHLFPGGDLPRWNFTDFGHSFMIIFRVLCGEWIESMWDCMLVAGGACVPFFLATVLVGNLVILNLFLALLLSSFGGPNMGPPEKEEDKIAIAFGRIGRFIGWVKGGIRAFFKAILDGLIRMKNRIVPERFRPQPEPEPEPPASRPELNALRARGGRRPRLAQAAQLVMNSKKLMNNLQELKEAEAQREQDQNNTTQPATTTTPLPPMPQDSPGSHKAYFNRQQQLQKQQNIQAQGGNLEDVDVDEDFGDGDDAGDEFMDDWLDDKEGDEQGEDGEAVQMPKGEIEDDAPADCMPAAFYEKFPVFDVEDTPFGVFWANLRLKTFRLIENKYFETAVITMILLSSLAMAFEDVNLPSNPILTDVLFHMDRIFTVIFFFEMLIKWLAMGFATYFTNAWCWLDFVIVMVSLINLLAALLGAGSVQAFKTLKTLRALRPLRAMSRMQGMRIVVNALVGAIPSIANVLMVCLIFWLIFAIMGVQLFNGKFHKCIDPIDQSRPDYRIIKNKVECLANNFTWENSVMNFDHVGKAYLSLFQVATFKGWIGIMNDAIDSREIDDQPHREVSFTMYGYFVSFIIFGSFFTLNLFIGVIIDNFNEQKKKSGGSMEMFMTEDQKKYYAAMQKMGGKKPIKAIPRPTWKPQAIVFDFVINQKFDMFIMLLIGLNMLAMTMDHYQMSPEWENFLGIINTIFVAVFTCECFCKMFCLRQHYFKEPWNLFDLVVVFMSVAGMMLSDLIEKYFVSPTLLRVVRVAKVGRVLRLIKGAKGIRTLLFALVMSLPALFNICLLLFLVMFIFAVFGMSFFMNVKLRGALDDVYNFQTCWQSIILLFQISTSAGWDGVLDGIMNEDDCELPDPELGRSGDCGNATVAIAFLLAYLVMTFLIIINMYIAVILENYSQATEDVQEGLTEEDYDMYYEIWAQFDPDGTQYIRYDQLSDLLDVVEPPLQIHKPNKFKIITMDIPICKGDMMYCVDILDALTKDFFARKGNVIDEAVEIDDVAVAVDRPGYVRISSTLWRQREEYCARLIQNAWRRRKAGFPIQFRKKEDGDGGSIIGEGEEAVGGAEGGVVDDNQDSQKQGTSTDCGAGDALPPVDIEASPTAAEKV